MHAYLFVGSENPQEYIPKTAGEFLSQCNISGIDDVRSLKKELAISQNRNIYIVLPNIDKVGEEAQNALLKILEEPPSQVSFVLTAGTLTGIAETIISRCQVIIGKKSNHTQHDETTFLEKTFAERFDFIARISTPTEAQNLLEEIILKLHADLVSNNKQQKNSLLLRQIENTKFALNKVKANGNTYLQLLNYAVELS